MAALTFSRSGGEELPAKLASPLYTAVMEWLPGLRVDTARVAVSAVLSATVPSVVASSSKVMLPLGVPLPGGVTVRLAVKVTVWPCRTGFASAINETGVAAWFTTWLKTGDVLPLKFASPVYTAVNECMPTAKRVVVKEATPETSSLVLPIVVVPSSS